jgi:hypothetical protein
MEKIQKVLSKINQENFLTKAIELGINPQEIKDAVIETLGPYFEDKELLIKYSINLLVPQFINLMKIQQDDWSFEIFENCYHTYRMAKNQDRSKCFESMAFWHSDILECISKFWTIFNLEQDKDMLENDEMVFECFRNIGDIIEGLSKPFLKNLLSQINIIDGSLFEFSDINYLDLGGIVNELIQRCNYQQLFMPPPWDIKLNHWRNIAYHHNYKIRDDEITCWYGKGRKKIKIIIPKKEMMIIVKKIFNCFMVQRLAYDLFFIDNIASIEKYLSNQQPNIRFEALFLNVAAAISSQGFEIVDFMKSPDKSKLTVKDRTNLDPLERSAHASQFLYSLWFITKSRKMIVEYWEKDGTPKYLFELDSDICEMIRKGDKKFCDIANEMAFVNLKS